MSCNNLITISIIIEKFKFKYSYFSNNWVNRLWSEMVNLGLNIIQTLTPRWAFYHLTTKTQPRQGVPPAVLKWVTTMVPSSAVQLGSKDRRLSPLPSFLKKSPSRDRQIRKFFSEKISILIKATYYFRQSYLSYLIFFFRIKIH